MRKKSAFLEKLTARAAAAFEAGSSFGAPDDLDSQVYGVTQSNHVDQEQSTVTVAQAISLAGGLMLQEPNMGGLVSLAPEQGAGHGGESESVMATGAMVDVGPTAGHSLGSQPNPQPEPKQPEPTQAGVGGGAEQGAVGLSKNSIECAHGSHVDDASNRSDSSAKDFVKDNLSDESKDLSTDTEDGQASQDVELAGQINQASLSNFIQQIKPAKASIISPEDDEERVCASLGFVAKVLFAHMIAMEKNVLNMKKLRLYNQNNMVISYASIRTAWGRLKELGIISHSARHDIGKEKGVLFQLNGQYAYAFQKLYGHMLVDVQGEQGGQLGTEQGTQLHTQRGTEQGAELHMLMPKQQGLGIGSLQSRHQTGQQSGQQSGAQGSEGALVQSQEDARPRTKLEVHPEYNLWREHGLTQTQCVRWREEFGLDELLLDSYLRWCAMDIGQGERKDKTGKAISNPANWFYSILKKTGSYPKPEGYLSHEEKTFIAREQALREQADLQARQNTLRAQEERQEAETLFVAFLEEGESSPHFHELCQNISPFLYENRQSRRRLFENALRTEYFKFLGIAFAE